VTYRNDVYGTISAYVGRLTQSTLR